MLGTLACASWLIFASASWEDVLDHGPGIGTHKGFPTFKTGTELLESWIKQYPHLLQSVVLGQSYEKRDIKAYVLSVKEVKIKKPQVLLTSLMHAREPAGLTVLMHFIGHILEEYSAGRAQAQYLLTTREIWCIPFVNPDGYVANERIMRTARIGARKNRRPTPGCRRQEDSGVDINRNFGYQWHKKFPACDEEYQGTAPFSEPETKAVKKVCDENHFQLAINYHTFGEMLTHPFNYAEKELLPKDDQDIYLDFKKVFKWKKFGPAIRTVHYTAIGESDDWMYGAKGIISMSPEVGPENAGFWPPAHLIKGIDSKLYAPTAYGARKAGLELVVELQLYKEGADGISMALTLHNKGLTTSLGDTLGIALELDPAVAAGNVTLNVSATASQVQSTFTVSGSSISVQLPPLQRRSSTTVTVAVHSAAPLGVQDKQLQLCAAEVLPEPLVMCHCSDPVRIDALKATPAGTHFSLGSDRLCSAAKAAQSLQPKTAGTVPPPTIGFQSGLAVGSKAGTASTASTTSASSSSISFLDEEESEAMQKDSRTVILTSLAGAAAVGLAAHFALPLLKRRLKAASVAHDADPMETVGLQEEADVVGAPSDETV